MRITKYFLNLIIVLLFIFFLIGCQQVSEVSEQEPSGIEISTEESIEETADIINEELEKEFDDGLDEALKELEEVENI